MEKVKSDSKITDWYDGGYLYYMLSSGSWAKLKPIYKPSELPGIKELAFKIAKSKRYDLISRYFQFYLKLVDIFYDKNLNISLNGYIFSPDVDLGSDLMGICVYLHDEICGTKEKLLVGTGSGIPLWLDIPKYWYIHRPGQHYWQYQKSVGLFLLHALHLFSGEARQQAYDRLVFPSVDRWPLIDGWDANKSENFRESIAEHLGFPEGFVSEDEFVQILSEAFLNQKYVLVINKPVLVRLEEHPSVFQIILLPKDDRLIAKISTYNDADYLTVITLQEISKLDITEVFDATAKGIKRYEDNHNWAIQALIASIYRDLVTVEEKEISSRRVAGKRKPDLKTKKIDPLEPKLFTTSWQYIPRRQYIYNRPDDSSYMDREPLSEADQHKQRAIRKWHMVCGHIRRYRDKPDWMASGDKQDQALADGVLLRTGETYVRPHARNADALAELGEIDINSIPHYMRRKMAS